MVKEISRLFNGGLIEKISTDLKHPEILLPSQIHLLRGYESLLQLLHDDCLVSFDQLNKFIARTSNLNLKKVHNNANILKLNKLINEVEFDRLRSIENDLIEIDIHYTANKINLPGLLYGLNEILPKAKGRAKLYDAYLLTEVPIDRIIIKLMEKPSEKSAEPKEPPSQKSVEHTSVKEASSGKSVEPSSVKEKEFTQLKDSEAKCEELKKDTAIKSEEPKEEKETVVKSKEPKEEKETDGDNNDKEEEDEIVEIVEPTSIKEEDTSPKTDTDDKQNPDNQKAEDGGDDDIERKKLP
ncbi:unnamed protein product [Ambrosiozyma monospora]|uniref:Unnamed protein product n=1 Tax=Ambrosiozyma monospora TaxID=43982 RepID=A0ACB5U0J3_AMBMO|nr:unnamed protein product [Ambrosiozyma monospora]